MRGTSPLCAAVPASMAFGSTPNALVRGYPLKPHEHEIAFCCEMCLTVQRIIRNLVAGIQLRPRPPDQYTALLRELAAIGNNINQIAHWANAKKSIHEAEIVEAAVLANKAWRLVKDTL